ncbi:ankyrin repeat-containing [Trichoderma arundinaceum]|uniref:Ankyrin repeat-containing n=1 Tax=Trichoderma arundinaceum TaxID=490622 RepID=A0A395NV76_TRIAR|nr:ankyrin repeat-containing [Trichoderma arundinaceum]
MLSALFIALLLNLFQPCEGSPRFQEEYRGSYVPEAIETSLGLQIVAPDTPYVAAAGQNKLHFFDTRLDAETARHIKEQIERATVPKPDEVISMDEISATAEVKNHVTGETTFIFDPVYARVLFAKGMNRRNPKLNLPEPEAAGDQLVTYDLDAIWAKL